MCPKELCPQPALVLMPSLFFTAFEDTLFMSLIFWVFAGKLVKLLCVGMVKVGEVENMKDVWSLKASECKISRGYEFSWSKILSKICATWKKILCLFLKINDSFYYFFSKPLAIVLICHFLPSHFFTLRVCGVLKRTSIFEHFGIHRFLRKFYD